MKSEKELREEYISSLESGKFAGWVITIGFSIITLLLWIFGNTEWTFVEKISATIFGIIIIYFLGIVEIREANKKLKEELE